MCWVKMSSESWLAPVGEVAQGVLLDALLTTRLKKITCRIKISCTSTFFCAFSSNTPSKQQGPLHQLLITSCAAPALEDTLKRLSFLVKSMHKQVSQNLLAISQRQKNALQSF